MMNRDRYVPTLNLDQIDPQCADLDYLRGEFRQMSNEYVMNNNFAFGEQLRLRWREHLAGVPSLVLICPTGEMECPCFALH